jgi:signal transduction histidine kinase
MSLAMRITAGLCLVVALGAGLAAYQLQVVEDLVEENRALGELDVQALSVALGLWPRLGEIEELSRKYRVLEDERYVRELERARADFLEGLEELHGVTLGTSLERQVEELRATWLRYALAGDAVEQEAAAIERLHLAVGEVLGAARLDLSGRVQASALRRDRARRLAWWWTGGAVALGAVLSLLIARSVASPLARLAAGTREVAAGNFAYQVTPRGSREVADLARDFNTMATRLRELDDLKRDLVSNVSHDLKAPLASMLETGRLLLDGVPGPLGPSQRELLEIQLRSGERLSRLIGDLLEVARLEAGVEELVPASVDLVDLVARLVEEASPALVARRVTARARLPESPLVVPADPDLLARAVSNLLDNAVKFTPEGSEVGVELATENGSEAGEKSAWARLEIWDRGPGIPDADKRAVFTRFHRADRERRGRQGVGLGLAIASQVAALHTGSLHVEDRDGGGSCFVLRLRCSQEGRAA